MKRGIYVFALILILSLSFIIAELTGEVITGKAHSQSTDVSLTMDNDAPLINLDSPENRTYVVTNISLNYSVYDSSTGVDTVWYSIDGGPNMTLYQNITINVSDYTSHSITIYVNDSVGNLNFTSVNFFVNSSLGWLVNTTKYGGDTTDFWSLYYAGKPYELNLDSITIERVGHGKIYYTEKINITRHIFDFDDYSHILSDSSLETHYVTLDSETIPEFNKSSIITFYNVTFADPQILKDGEICGRQCSEISYSGGTFVFSVTSFTTYSLRETPSEEDGEDTGGGDGGEGISSEIDKRFKVEPGRIKIDIKQGQIKREELVITNLGNSPIKLALTFPKLEKFLKVSEREIELNSKESKKIYLDFRAKIDDPFGVYFGDLIVKGEEAEKKVFIAIDISSRETLFDIGMFLPEEYLYVLPGEKVAADITIYNLGELEEVGVNMEYLIKDVGDNVILEDYEPLIIKRQKELTKEFILPENIPLGEYMFNAKLRYKDSTASTTIFFTVGERPFKVQTMGISIIILILMLFLLFLLYKRRRREDEETGLKFRGFNYQQSF